ncbi:MAG: hypothetical protein AB1489_22580 [Acidobacteriota bacterium]
MLTLARYDSNFLFESFNTQLEEQIKQSRLSEADAAELRSEYEKSINSYTYLG